MVGAVGEDRGAALWERTGVLLRAHSSLDDLRQPLMGSARRVRVW